MKLQNFPPIFPLSYARSWQIPFNIKEQYPFGKPKTIVMLAAGTGITPMYQVKALSDYHYLVILSFI
jgi:hypothetical protein